jgi:hypothetical protein
MNSGRDAAKSWRVRKEKKGDCLCGLNKREGGGYGKRGGGIFLVKHAHEAGVEMGGGRNGTRPE